MKKILLICFCSIQFAKAQNITAAEYFFNADPGVGNGIAVPVGVGADVINFTATIPTAFSPGFNIVAIRVKDANNVWSLFESRGFYSSASVALTTDITAAEYFFDSDPGVGNGVAISPSPTGSTVNFSLPIPTALPVGFHYVAIRVKDANGIWSLFETRGFYISGSTTNTSAIIASEYFFDTDPGTGNGIAANIGTSGNTVNFTATIPTALTPGFHFIAIRTKDAEGKWGLFETRGFYISANTNEMPFISAAEYFFDADPGVGNAAPLSVGAPANIVTPTFSIPVPLGTSQGDHLLAIRVKDQNDVWSLFEVSTITVAGTLPLQLLSFSGKKIGEDVRLNWKTDNEINTSHFIIERSNNGVSFSPIGNVTASNTSGVNNYLFDDLQPENGVNFYRLKQVDIGGQFKYSPIIKILMSERVDDMKVYPNPATDKLNVEFASTQKNIFISIFDATGKSVFSKAMANANPLQVNISHLAKGTYWLQLSDGINTKQITFIKQ